MFCLETLIILEFYLPHFYKFVLHDNVLLQFQTLRIKFKTIYISDYEKEFLAVGPNPFYRPFILLEKLQRVIPLKLVMVVMLREFIGMI